MSDEYLSFFINDNIFEDKFSKFLFQKCVYQIGSPSHEFVPRSSSQFQKVCDPCPKRFVSVISACFYLSPPVFLMSVSLVKMFWFLSLCSDLFNLALSFFAFSDLVLAFQLFTRKFGCKFQFWGCVILHVIDFLLKICQLISSSPPVWRVHTWI